MYWQWVTFLRHLYETARIGGASDGHDREPLTLGRRQYADQR